MGSAEHKEKAGNRPVKCAVITCSDTRTEENDVSGKLIQQFLLESGHEIVHYQIVKDSPDEIRHILKTLDHRADVQAILFNGGTGVSRRDTTYDVVAAHLTKVLPGFGELFRYFSVEEVGSSAMLSRAIAGIVVTEGAYGHEQHVVVFSMPGSPNAVEVAMTKLIVPELSHLAWEITR
jgi:molybdenum cofactor biosynthesis protein B